MKTIASEIQIKGLPVCRGIAIGKSIFFDHLPENVPEFEIAKKDIDQEISHFRQAVQQGQSDVVKLKNQLEMEGAHEGAAILEGHLQIMQDPLLTTHIENEIKNVKKNAEFVFHTHVNQYRKKFSSISDPFFRERFKDLLSVSRRIMSYLREGDRVSLAGIPHNSIVFAHEIAASDSAEAKVGSVSAFVTKSGGPTSHAAIVAKAKGIPYVANVDVSILKKNANNIVIVDGRTGDIFINPEQPTIEKYQKLQCQLNAHFQRLEKTGGRQSETIDGYQVQLSANVDMVHELDLLAQYGNHGIGLFRTEYVCLSQGDFPSEEEQTKIYQLMIEKMNGLPVVIRSFDIGGDKFIRSRKKEVPEDNSYLGCRAIRFLLKEKHIFKTQLRAILRASAYGKVSVMFPMISGLQELIEAKKIINEAREELIREGHKIEKQPLRIGCMIEVPSAAIISDLLARECDFLSIGTNDLVQYALAVDRDNQAISWMYNPAHPGVIRLLKLIVEQANHFGIPVALCGEMASDPRFTPLLLGLGIQELSVSSRYIPIIKNAIRSTYILSAIRLVEKALTLTTAQDIQALLNQEYQHNVPEDFFYNC